MSLLVVGATGTLGRQVARRALDEGHQVRCLVRSPKKAAFLKEWGAELVRGDLCAPESLPPALAGVTAVIDAATARPTDSLSVKQVDWDGKVALIQAAKAAGVERYIFFSILDAEKYPHVPLMEIKRCTELFLAESGLNYTTLRLCGFMQGLIGQYAIPILENQAVWVTGESAPVAYMDTQDIAKFAIRALSVPETENKVFPVVGTRAWSADEIIALCERLSGQQPKVTRLPLNLLRTVRQAAMFFQWGWNADYPDPENFFFLLYGPNAKVRAGGENAANYRNPEFDRWFERMRNMDDGEARLDAIQRLQQIVRHDAPWIFGFHPTSFSLHHAWYRNLKPNQMANNELKYQRIVAGERVEQQRRWNQPVVWPLVLGLLALAAMVAPAWVAYRRRLQAAAL